MNNADNSKLHPILIVSSGESTATLYIRQLSPATHMQDDWQPKILLHEKLHQKLNCIEILIFVPINEKSIINI